MSGDYTRSDIPLYEEQTARDAAYQTAERDGEPYLAIEAYEDGYAITYDLLPAGVELAPTAHSELRERVAHAVEEVVGDDGYSTVEVSQTVSASLGNLGVFDRERAAREVAVVVAGLVLDENNWVEDDSTDTVGGSIRRN